MSKIDFYFFSGTGNSKRVVDWFCSEALKNGIETKNINLSNERFTPPPPGPETLVGFISPTHGFNYPPLMIKYLLRFPRSEHKTKVFLMNTRAGMKLSKIFLPGFSGIALWLAALILLLKGYRIIALRSIDLPSNWISLHPGLRQKVVQSMFGHYEEATRVFARQIIAGRKVFKPSMILSFPIDIAIAPIALAYYLVGRFVIAKSFVSSLSCDKCGLCIRQCPVKAISMVNDRPYWSFRCESCMHCMNICPKRAIETAHGLLAAIIFILYSLILSAFYSWFPFSKWPVFSSNSILDKLIRFTFESVILFLLLLIVYRFTHYLKRYQWFDTIITYTSLTKYRFWRRYKAPKSPYLF
jgi:ferredoxin